MHAGCEHDLRRTPSPSAPLHLIAEWFAPFRIRPGNQRTGKVAKAWKIIAFGRCHLKASRECGAFIDSIFASQRRKLRLRVIRLRVMASRAVRRRDGGRLAFAMRSHHRAIRVSQCQRAAHAKFYVVDLHADANTIRCNELVT